MSHVDTIHLQLPAKYQYLNIIGETLKAISTNHPVMSQHPDTSYNLHLAVHEAAANVVEHAYRCDETQSFEMDVEIWEHPTRLVVKLRDRGHSFDPDVIPPPALGSPQMRGFGMFLMQHLLDEAVYESQEGGNCWTLVKNFESPLKEI